MGTIASTTTEVPAPVRDLFDHSLVWDNHTCTTIHPGRAETLAGLRRHKRAGIDVVGLNVGFDAAPAEDAITLLAEFRRWLGAHDDEFQLVETAADIEQARNEGKLAVFFNIEGGNALRGQKSMVSLLYRLGVRWMLFAYNRSNALAGGCQDRDEGLTDFGREVLSEMEEVGMLVCCSHIGERSAREIMERARKPVIFSHSNPYAVWPHARNISDAAMRACAATGGVVGINGIGIFLGDNDARVETMVRHIRHAIDIVGTEHVSLALDYAFDQDEVDAFVKANPDTYPAQKYPNGIEMVPPEAFPQLAERLLACNVSEGAVRNILGGNLLRVAREVWK